jgi:hypothetical protein
VQFEAALAPKPFWTHHKMSAGVIDRMMRAILPVEMAVTKVDSTFKLNQNRSDAARAGAADALALGLTPGSRRQFEEVERLFPNAEIVHENPDLNQRRHGHRGAIQFQVSQQSWETALAVGGIALLMVGIFGAAAAVDPR